ncbi:MAG: hypothetical protein HN472_07140 [Nitrospina sp.]|jgi:hypothetical protein|nr:hypothetical protein [Nitrospina sp.]MBT3876625.1 hypothetical protein [Nitrospina sp.]MBT4049684.1 hypothetical protein [Nitrospina sp.]MBT4556465.1 hypothetical protein [Nitrospina sp.]
MSYSDLAATINLVANNLIFQRTIDIGENIETMQAHLREIDNKIDSLLKQNAYLMEQMNALPLKIYEITDTVVRDRLLGEHYLGIQSQQAFFRGITNLEQWERNRNGWLLYNEHLYNVFHQEYRISYIPRLIQATELALVVYGFFALHTVRLLVGRKLDWLKGIRETIEDNLNSLDSSLLSLLNNSRFVKDHNFGEELDDFKKLSISYHGHKNKTETYVYEDCDFIDSDFGRGPREICHSRTNQRTIPDTIYNNQHDAHIAKVEKVKSEFIKQLPIFANLKEVEKFFQTYANSISQEGLPENLGSETIEFSNIAAEEMLNSSNMNADRFLFIKKP